MGIISKIDASAFGPVDQEIPAAFAALTPTQYKVLQGVYSGLLNKQIAFDLGIAEATVKAHMTALMRKLNVRNRTQVAIVAQSAFWARQTDAAAA
jgi:DNA-binding NarL/FixJ family response regulator